MFDAFTGMYSDKDGRLYPYTGWDSLHTPLYRHHAGVEKLYTVRYGLYTGWFSLYTPLYKRQDGVYKLHTGLHKV